ncbi:MAG: tRNA glutamyl-Q(34) synthetase GluQRS [Butyricicoccus sp.]|nr:tRNA glutamyl-Q(34) synthetase GluQRS [Butyricicoccus sp.]
MEISTVGRFAPSPSGRMHLGNVLCALLAWLSARSKGGACLLRIEDLDEMRCPRSHAAQIIDDLHWLGLTWNDPDPDNPGAQRYAAALADIPENVLRSAYQSDRTPVYTYFEGMLREKGLLYPCFCSRAALHAASAPHLSDGRVIYTGTCRGLLAEEIAEKRKTRQPATRVLVPDEEISFVDGCMGPYRERLQDECGDFIIRRSDGVFAYQLAVTVDDGLMGVTEVVRGNDLIGSTARQIWLHRLFGFTPPAFYHMPLLLAPDGRRLSKRDEDLDLGRLRQHMHPERLVGALAFAAGLIDRDEPVAARDLVGAFSWDKVPKTDLYLPDIFRDL